MSEPTRLIVADDHPLLVDALVQLFSGEPDLEVVARCASGSATLEALERERPDILILDLRMPEGDGFEILRRVRDGALPTRVIVLTASADRDDLVEAIKLGARGIVLKEMAPETLLRAVRKVRAGGRWLEHESASRAIDILLDRETGRLDAALRLTSRELDVVRWLVEGLRNREIAEKLFISEGTVKVHLHNVFEKVGVRSRLQLAREAQKRGWV